MSGENAAAGGPGSGSAATVTPPGGLTIPETVPAASGGNVVPVGTAGEPISCACPACGNGFRLPAAANGRASNCPFCKKRFRIRAGLGELIGALGQSIVTACGACTRRVWVGEREPLLDRLCPICHAGRLQPVAGEPPLAFDAPAPTAGPSPLSVWDDVPLSFAGAAPQGPDAVAASLAPGTTLAGRYVIERLLRVDRVSAYYHGRDTIQEKERTLQVLFPSLTGVKETLAGLLTLSEKLVALGGQGILAAHGSAQDGERGLWLLAFDPIRGMPLSSWLAGVKATGKHPERPVRERLALRLMEALSRAPQTLSHGFVLPENVLLTATSEDDGGNVVLMGHANVARLAPGDAAATCPEALTRFLAPEKSTMAPPSLPGDIFAAASIAAEVLSGEPARGPETRREMLGPEVRPEAAAILVKALDAIPGSRPATFFQLAAALTPAAAPPPPPPPPAPAPAPAQGRVDTPDAQPAVTRRERAETPRRDSPRDASAERIADARRRADERAKRGRLTSLAVFGVIVLAGIIAFFALRTTEPPLQLVSLEPEDRALLPGGPFTVRGRLAVPSPVRVVVNGVSVPVDATGRFQADLVPEIGDEMRLEVKGFGPEGIVVAKRAVVIDRKAPFLDVLEPSGELCATSSVKVAGRVEDKNLAEVRVNGQPAIVEGDRFTRLVPVAQDGPLQIEVTAIDRAGNRTEVKKPVTRDTQPPVMALADPLAALADEPSVRVRVRIQDATLATVEALGEKLEPARMADGTAIVTFDWALSPGMNRAEVIARDKLGQETRLPLNVRRDTPELASKPKAEAIPRAEPKPATPVAQDLPLDEEAASFLEVPLVGAFGDEITAEGVEEALAYAERKKIPHVVMVLDSGGGMVAVADEIQKSMDRHDAALTYHVVIRRAISASIWVVFSADRIYLAEGASVGGAVVYSRAVDTGNAEVDAKMNSILAADMVARADKKTHPSILVKPMMLKASHVYAWHGPDGTIKLAEEKPKGVTSFVVSDDADTVLTLTGKQAAAVGLGKTLAADPKDIPAAMRRPNWKTDGDFGANAMERGKKTFAAKKAKVEKALEKFEDAVRMANRYLDAAAAMDPAKFTYMTGGDGRFTPAAAQQWRERTDACISAYRKVLTALSDCEREDKNVQKLGFPSQLDRSGVKDLRERVKIAMNMLAQGRSREGP